MKLLRNAVSFSGILVLLLTPLRAPAAAAGFYNTYATWGDRSEAKHGHLYLYTGSAASTDYFLYATGVAGTTINNLVQTQTAVGPYQPVTAYPSNEDSNPGFGNSYFKLSSTNPMTWEVDETTECHCGDTQGMVAAADNLNNYVGSVFMTYMRRDSDAEAPGGSFTLSMFGDQFAVISTAAVPITAKVSKWNGAAWVTVVAASPSIPAGGIWMWSPDESPSALNGGTLAANAGHYRIDLTGGQGLLYKGNMFSPMPFLSHGYTWNRDNGMLVCPDLITGKKIGLNLVGAVIADHGSSPQVIVSNPSASSANFTLQRFVPTSPGAVDSQWPISGNDPSGVWTVVQTVTGLASGANWAYTSPNDGFDRVVSTNGVSITAIMGTALTRSRYVGGDYLYGKDTLQAIGKSFDWWGHLQNTSGDGPLEIHVVAPWAGTQVTVVVDGASSGASYFSQVQTTSGVDQGLLFNVPSSTDQDVHFKVTADQYVYVWAASNTGLSSDGYASQFGETFYSNPPMPQNLLVAEKTVDPATATLTDHVTYVLTARNIGAGDALSVQIWDTLPTGLSYVSASTPPTYSVPPLFGWSLGTVAALSAQSVTLVAQVDTATNGEIKSNTILVDSTATSTQSVTTHLRVLIPGADLQKSANVGVANPGDTITYSINYFNSAAALPTTPQYDLKVKGSGYDSNNINLNFEIDNNSGSPVTVSDFKIVYWVYDAPLPGQITPNVYYGGNTTPWAGWGGPSWSASISSISPAITRPDSRNANLQVTWSCTTASSLPSGSKLDGINLDLSAGGGSNWTPANNTSVSYSRRPSDASYIEDGHYALYYQGNLVGEYTAPGVADPNTGVEPQNWVEVYDSCPAQVSYLGSNPAATSGGGASPFLSWFAPSVPPQATAAFTWWGTVNLGTPGGTEIDNRALAQANTITVLSNLATVVVPIVGTLTNTPTPSASFTASPSQTVTPSASPTATPSASVTPIASATVTPSFSNTSTPGPSSTSTLTPTNTATLPPTPVPPTDTPTPEPLRLSPLPPSPHPATGDGVHIAYRLSVDSTVDIKIFDIAGEVVRSLDPFPGLRGADEEFWDLRNSAGSSVSSGIFIARVQATSAANEVQVIYIKVAVAR